MSKMTGDEKAVGFLDSTGLKTHELDFRRILTAQLFTIMHKGSNVATTGLIKGNLINFKNSIRMIDSALTPFTNEHYKTKRKELFIKLQTYDIDRDYDARFAYYDCLVDWLDAIIQLMQDRGLLIEQGATMTLDARQGDDNELFIGDYDEVVEE